MIVSVNMYLEHVLSIVKMVIKILEKNLCSGVFGFFIYALSEGLACNYKL